jgi:hypothetical protein
VTQESRADVKLAVLVVGESGAFACRAMPAGDERVTVSLKRPLGHRKLLHAPLTRQ